MTDGRFQPPGRLIDITRLTSRIGRVFTGVDRVELAYLRAVAADPVPAFALARTALGYVLLDEKGIARFLACIDAADWPRPDLVSRLNRRLDRSAKLGQTLVRQLSRSRCLRGGLRSMVAKALPDGFTYLNVGHSNLTKQVLTTLKTIANTRLSVLIHDTIPLDFPHYQRPGTVDAFAAKLARVSACADLVICISEASKADVARHMKNMGRVPPMVAAHLGVDLVKPGAIPAHIPHDRPYFVTVGTIEPRKNHAVLLDVWTRFGEDAPRLLICGSRGWNNESVFEALDSRPQAVTELSGLSDPALAAVIQGAQALLFPTFAEGFGLPPLEARALGVPVICSDLPVLRETLSNQAVYLGPTDADAWEAAIRAHAGADRSQVRMECAVPTWESHFKIVFTMS